MTWTALFAIITTAELRATMLVAMTAAGLPTTTWTKDKFWQNLLNWFSGMFRLALMLIRDVALNSFLDTATGQGLTDLAQGTFGTPRRTATFATGIVTLWNQSGTTLDEAAESISFELVANSEITYKNTEQVFALNGQIVFVPIVCDIAGTVGNAAAGTSPTHTIELVTVLTGVSVTQNTAVVGQDEMADEPLRQLARKQAAVASTAHGNKYEFYALNTNTDGTIAEANDGKVRTNVNRVHVSFENAQGLVFVVLASPLGPVDPAEYTTTIEVLEQYALTNPGILVDFNATAVPLDLELTVELDAGASTSGVEDEMETYISDWFVSVSNKIGGGDGFITVDELKLLAGRANNSIRKVTIDLINGGAPADVPIGLTEVATLNSIAVTVTVQS